MRQPDILHAFSRISESDSFTRRGKASLRLLLAAGLVVLSLCSSSLHATCVWWNTATHTNTYVVYDYCDAEEDLGIGISGDCPWDPCVGVANAHFYVTHCHYNAIVTTEQCFQFYPEDDQSGDCPDQCSVIDTQNIVDNPDYYRTDCLTWV